MSAEVLALLVGLAVTLLTGPLLRLIHRSQQSLLRALEESANQRWGAIFVFTSARGLLGLHGLAAGSVALLLTLFAAPWPVVLLLSLIALGLPEGIRRWLHQRRLLEINRQLADALQGLADMLRSGASFQSALETLVRESHPPISQEFGLILKELRMGLSVAEAFRNLELRCPLEDLRLLVAGVIINREVGGSLSDLLLSLASTIRRKQEMRGKIDALTAQGRMQGWVMTALPGLIALAIYSLEPRAMAMLFQSIWGWAVVTVSVVMLALGYAMIRKIVRIDI